MPSTVDPDALRRATDAFSEAVLDPDQWPAILDELGAATASTGIVLFLFGGRDRASFRCSHRLAGAMDDYLTSDWCVRNPRLQTPPTVATHSDMDFMKTERQAREMEAFRDGFLRKHDMGWFAGTSLYRDSERQILISVERPFRLGAFDTSDLHVLAQTFERMRGIVSLVPSLDARLRTAMLDGFAGRGQAAAVLGRGGKLLGLNQAAERLLPTVLRIRHGCLRAIETAQASAWSSFVARLTASMSVTERLCSPILLATKGGDRVIVRGTPLPASADALFRSAAALVFLDEVKGPRLQLNHLRSSFGLTQAEARLAMELACCFDLVRAGQVLGIKHETARSHLKAIFAKTASSSQAECVAKLTRLG